MPQTATAEPDNPLEFSRDLDVARREVDAACRALAVADPSDIQRYSERAAKAAGATANLSSLAALAARRARR